MKTLADTKSELVKKVEELTENFAADLEGKGIGEKKGFQRSIIYVHMGKNEITHQKTVGSKIGPHRRGHRGK